MKIKTSELQGRHLDWAVGASIDIAGLEIFHDRRREATTTHFPTLNAAKAMLQGRTPEPYQPSSNWMLGGPIIQSYEIGLEKTPDGWVASVPSSGSPFLGIGPRPLIAAMRALVLVEVGEGIVVPDSLGVHS